MLGDEDGMAFRGSLVAIVGRLGGSEAVGDKTGGVGQDGVEAAVGEVGSLAGAEPKTAAEFRAR